MFLEFHLVFYIIFQIFFEISEFQFKKSTIFKIEPGRSRQNRPVFLTLHRTPFSLKEQLVINLTLVKLDIFFLFLRMTLQFYMARGTSLSSEIYLSLFSVTYIYMDARLYLQILFSKIIYNDIC
jgi:hypothetical protein